MIRLNIQQTSILKYLVSLTSLFLLVIYIVPVDQVNDLGEEKQRSYTIRMYLMYSSS
jgi:hypothetical protein